MKINKDTAEHYFWHEVCDGWHLVKSDELSVILERMPPHTEEDMHYHTKSRQFFYILSGEGCMLLDSGAVHLKAGDGIEIQPMEKHQMKNDSESAVEFFVVSSPKSHGDKVIV